MYPDPRVEALIRDNLVPIRIDVRKKPELMERFNVQWTPTILLLGPDGREHHRIEGFLETDDFLAQLLLGLGHVARARGKWDEAIARYEEVLARHPDGDAAPAAQYWRGVARYKKSGDPAELGATTQAFKERYADTPWATRASVWG